MRCIDDKTVDELAKSSTILQCIVSILEFECAKYHFQPEIVWVGNNEALVSVGEMIPEEITAICEKVNVQFQRRDGANTCRREEHKQTMIRCRALPLSEYIRLT